MKNFKEKYNIFCNKVKLYLCELKKKDIKFSDIIKFVFKILCLIFLFCLLATTIFKSCSNSNQNHIEPKRQLKSEVRANEDILGTWEFNKPFNDPVQWISSYTEYSVTFSSNEQTFDKIIVQYISEPSFYLYYCKGAKQTLVCTGYGKIFENDNYKTISITDISNLTNRTELLNWLNEYAIKQTEPEPPHECPWCYDGKRNGIYKFTDTLFSKTQILTLLFDFSSYGGNFNKLMVNKGVLSFGNDTETYQVATFNDATNKWDFKKNEDKYINLRHFQTENDYVQFDLQLIKGNILENISFEQFQKEIAKSAFDAGVDLTETTNNSIILFFTQLFQLPYMIFTTLFSPFTFELGGISINLGATLLGLMLVLLIIWVMKKFK